MAARENFEKELALILKEKLVFLDETGIEDNACPIYGWSPIGKRCYAEKIYQHTRRVSMIAGLCQGNIIAPVVFEGTCNRVFFETYVETMLIKDLKAGQIVVMDNINFHKTAKVKALVESVGCRILYLPTYSPDLNPIEHYWFKIKHQIRKIASNFSDFFTAVEQGLLMSVS